MTHQVVVVVKGFDRKPSSNNDLVGRLRIEEEWATYFKSVVILCDLIRVTFNSEDQEVIVQVTFFPDDAIRILNEAGGGSAIFLSKEFDEYVRRKAVNNPKIRFVVQTRGSRGNRPQIGLEGLSKKVPVFLGHNALDHTDTIRAVLMQLPPKEEV